MSFAWRWLFGLGLLLVLGACAGSPGTTTGQPTARPRSAADRSFISLERTRNGAGEAVGPVYIATLFEDGTVIFEGHAGVAQRGTVTRKIAPDQAAAVFREMDTIDLWRFERRYDVERMQRGGDSVIVSTASTDLPSEIIRVRDRGRSIRIDGLVFAPRELLDFKRLVETRMGLPELIAGVSPAP